MAERLGKYVKSEVRGWQSWPSLRRSVLRVAYWWATEVGGLSREGGLVP